MGYRTIPVLFSVVVIFTVGYLLGYGSTFVFGNRLPYQGARLPGLFVIPLLIGLGMMKVGDKLEALGKKRSNLETFINGALFAFSFMLARYFVAK